MTTQELSRIAFSLVSMVELLAQAERADRLGGQPDEHDPETAVQEAFHDCPDYLAAYHAAAKIVQS